MPAIKSYKLLFIFLISNQQASNLCQFWWHSIFIHLHTNFINKQKSIEDAIFYFQDFFSSLYIGIDPKIFYFTFKSIRYYLRFILITIMQHNSYRVRKNLASLKPSDPERVRYFISLKMIGILPPFSQEFEKWKYKNIYDGQQNSKQLTTPTTLHQVLMGSHSTSCQHGSIHFAYFHKHMLIIFELFLNFSHDVLLKMIESKSGNNGVLDVFKVLTQIYQPIKDSSIYKNLQAISKKEFSQKWDDLITFYEQNQKKLKPSQQIQQLAAHYWNAVSHKNIDQLLIPMELRIKDKYLSPSKYLLFNPKGPQNKDNSQDKYTIRANDVIDNLFLAIRKSYPWSINYKQLWKAKKLDWNGKKYQNQNQNQDEQDQFLQKNKDILSGKSVPRRQGENSTLMGITKWIDKKYFFQQGYVQRNSDAVLSRITKKQDIQSPANNFYLNAISELENIINYGGQVTYNNPNDGTATQLRFQFISRAQIDQWNKKAGIEKGSLNNGTFLSYNRLMPHYSFAAALYRSETFSEFLVNNKNIETIQSPHNVLHTSLKFIFSDPGSSVTSLAFFPYHSWVDLALQFKIRQMRVKSFQFVDKMNNLIPYDENNPLKSGSLIQILKKNQNIYNVYEKTTGYEKLTQGTIGHYPITEYITPNFNDDKQHSYFSVAFNQRDYSISLDNQVQTIRNSLQLNQIYQHYVNFYQDRFKNYQGFKSFIFSYNFDLNNSPIQQPRQLSLDGLNLPKYLFDMKDQFPGSSLKNLIEKSPEQREKQKKKDQGFEVTYEVARRYFKQNFSAPTKKYPQSIEIIFQSMKNTVKNKQLPSNSLLDFVQKKQLFSNSLLGYVKYPSNIKNGDYPLRIKVTQLRKKLFQYDRALFQNNDALNVIQYIENQGLIIETINIFGKQRSSIDCHNCKTFKHEFIQLDDSFKDCSSILWRIVHLNSLNQIVYHSRVSLEVNHNTNNEKKLKCITKQIQIIKPKGFQHFQLFTGSQEVQIDVSLQFLQKQKYLCLIRLDAFSSSLIQKKAHQTTTSKTKLATENIKFEFYNLDNFTSNKNLGIFDQYVYKKIEGWIYIQNSGTEYFKNHFQFQIPCYQRLVRYNLRIIEATGTNENDKEAFIVIIQDIDYKLKKQFYTQDLKQE